MAEGVQVRVDFNRQDLEELCCRLRITKLSFFGSVLRGDFTPESDIDVIVEFDPEFEYTMAYLDKVERALAKVFDRSVDLVEEGCLHSYVAADVEKRRRTVYVAQK